MYQTTFYVDIFISFTRFFSFLLVSMTHFKAVKKSDYIYIYIYIYVCVCVCVWCVCVCVYVCVRVLNVCMLIMDAHT